MNVEKRLADDLKMDVGNNLTLQDILNGEKLPENEMYSPEEVTVFWSHLPEERRKETEPHIKKFTGSLNDPPADFNGWQRLYHDSPLGSFELQLAVLMMALTAVSYREWLIVFNAANENQLKLKQVASATLRYLAVTASEHSVASRKYHEVNPASEPKEGA